MMKGFGLASTNREFDFWFDFILLLLRKLDYAMLGADATRRHFGLKSLLPRCVTMSTEALFSAVGLGFKLLDQLQFAAETS